MDATACCRLLSHHAPQLSHCSTPYPQQTSSINKQQRQPKACKLASGFSLSITPRTLAHPPHDASNDAPNQS